MIYSIIQSRKNAWVQSSECPVKPLLDYMRQQGQLRDAQMEAIETYLFLKIVGDNKPLYSNQNENRSLGSDMVEYASE